MGDDLRVLPGEIGKIAELHVHLGGDISRQALGERHEISIDAALREASSGSRTQDAGARVE
jgi:hypothetical protein